MKPTEQTTPRRRRWRLMGRGRNRRLRRAAASEPRHADKVEGAHGASWRSALAKRARAFLWGALRTVAVLAVLGAFGAGSFFGYRALRNTRAFDVVKIEVSGARHVLPAEIQERVASWRGVSIFALDPAAVKVAVERHPWVRSAQVTRVLPNTVRVVVEEQHAVAAVLLDAFYLVNKLGEIFKRATPAEADGLTVVTGPTRAEYVAQRTAATERIRRALDALTAYQAQIRPPLSEVHVGQRGEVTFFLRKNGTALRFGRMLSRERLRQLDAVWIALGPKSSRARALYLDHEVRANRVIVRMNEDQE